MPGRLLGVFTGRADTQHVCDETDYGWTRGLEMGAPAITVRREL